MLIHGRLVSAGVIDVGGSPRTGFFIETTGGVVAEAYRQEMYNKRVTISLDRRRQERKGHVTFHRLEDKNARSA